jgi:asparagine synthase (glutamine-hydrolysing)
MCGIAGMFNPRGLGAEAGSQLRSMLALIRHRGPDEFGVYGDTHAALGSARLSIIDLSAGQQPISNEDDRFWIVFNGEIFNFPELRLELENRGHRFKTHCDTEVILHLYEDLGPACLPRLNGQFAIAIWDARDRRLFLARDRLGVRPLFYAQVADGLVFGSEIKTLLADPLVRAEIDPIALEQVFTYWCALSPRTIFRGIMELPPGHWVTVGEGGLEIQKYWTLDFPPASALDGAGASARREEDYLAEFRELLVDAAKIRLRADVPVGSYLSGGLDSSTIASIIRRHTGNRLDTFSIAFTDVNFDESLYQRQMAQFLGTDHQVVNATHADIGRVFPEVIWHTEVPIMRTAPAPMFLLSKLVRQHGYKVVLTGEGADEFFGGYDLFKEAKIRRFWATNPDSKWRPLLLQRLYADIPNLSKGSGSFLAAFFREGLNETGSNFYSHAVRWRNNRRNCRFFSSEVLEALKQGVKDDLGTTLPRDFMTWEPLAKAQYLEATLFMSNYLLNSQGDRVAMANSVEGRFPFLDYRVVEFSTRLPARLKLRGLTEKYLLKQLARELLPAEIWQRPKRPYRAPIHRSFFNESKQDYVRELLSGRQIKATGLFNPAAVDQLVARIERGVPIGETDDMALAGILSAQLLHRQFVECFKIPAPISEKDKIKVCAGPDLS